MKRVYTTFFFLLSVICSFSQSQKVAVLLNGQFTQTIYDRTFGNNPWAPGLGIQVHLFEQEKWKPIIDLTAEIYLEDDKVLRLNDDGTSPQDLGSVINLFAGISYSPKARLSFACALGPSFSNGQTFLGIKPSVGFYFSESRRWAGKISFSNVFDRDKRSHKDFGSLSFTLGFRLY